MKGTLNPKALLQKAKLGGVGYSHKKTADPALKMVNDRNIDELVTLLTGHQLPVTLKTKKYTLWHRYDTATARAITVIKDPLVGLHLEVRLHYKIVDNMWQVATDQHNAWRACNADVDALQRLYYLNGVWSKEPSLQSTG